MWTAIAYPMTLVAALALWCWFILAAIVPGMARVFDDFGIQLPSMTASVIWLSVHRFALFFSLPLVFGCAVALIFLVGGRASLSNLFAAAPLFGPLWRDRGLAEFSSLLALLLEHSVPLPAALRTTANGLRDAGVAEASRRSAQSASEGQSLGDSLVGEPAFPWVLTPIVAWGERHSSLPAALRSAAEMFRARAELRQQFLATVLPPFIFVFVGATLSYVVIGLFMPLIKLIQTLSK
jgi:type IV pilus assembly protein PilC